MAIEYSTAYRNLLQGFCGKKQALMNGVFEIFTGSAPASPDNAATGTKLVRLTISSGGWTPEVLSYGTITLSGSEGQVDSITVNGVSLLSAVVVYSTDLATTAALVAANINANWTVPKYMASSSGAVVTITALPGTGTGPNTWVVVCTVSGGTLGQVTANMANGVAAINGLTFGGVSAGALQKTGIWSGVVLATGIAGYWRQTGSRNDDGLADTSPWTKVRMQGTCGTSGADYNMSTTSLTSAATHTMDTWIETLSED